MLAPKGQVGIGGVVLEIAILTSGVSPGVASTGVRSFFTRVDEFLTSIDVKDVPRRIFNLMKPDYRLFHKAVKSLPKKEVNQFKHSTAERGSTFIWVPQTSAQLIVTC